MSTAKVTVMITKEDTYSTSSAFEASKAAETLNAFVRINFDDAVKFDVSYSQCGTKVLLSNRDWSPRS